MLISEAKSKMIYYYDYFSKKVEEISYYDFVIEFGRDETTTPNGIAPRKFISETTYITYHFNDNESERKSDILYY